MSRDEFVVSEERLLPEFDAAGHVDEGTVHAWLDGAFDEAAASAVAAHVSQCGPCAEVVAEARGLVAASSRVLASLDVAPVAVSATPPMVAARAETARTIAPAMRPQWWWKAAAGLMVVIGGTVMLRQAGGNIAAGGGTVGGVTEGGTTGGGTTTAAQVLVAAPPVGAPPVVSPPVVPPPVASPPVASPSAPSLDASSARGESPLALNAATTTAPAPVSQQVIVGSSVAPASAPMPSPNSERRLLAREKAQDMGVVSSGRGVRPSLDREQYDRIEDNPFLGARNNPLSTFSIDVDRASYGNLRRFLTSGQRPPKDAVRIEELINYFPYELPEPRGNDPVAITSEVMAAPWQPRHHLVRIALQARRIATADLPPSNLVFLIDVSGSMNEWNKLPLVKQSLRLLVNELRPQDRVAIVAYAGAAGLVLPSNSGDEKARIAEAIDRLEAGGSTAGGAGIELAYRTAREHFLERGNNRVILATDGDFNVGVSSDAELERLVEQRRRDGTYLTVLGFGTGNYQAAKMEKLAKVGNGNAGYVDSPAEARKLLVEEMGATLHTVANDVKLQVEFNPSRVQAYRLIGYENRVLATEDFNDDTRDAGDIGTGHQVTALYEVVPVGVQGTVSVRGVDSLRYVTPEGRTPDGSMPDRSMGASPRVDSDELLFVKLRYKRPGSTASQLLTHAVPSRVASRPSADTRFIAAVASFGMLLRDSEYKGNSSAAQVLEQARAALGEDRGGYRAEFMQLVQRWRALGVTAGERR